MTHSREFLISELHRFYIENGRVPTQKDMKKSNGYPSYSVYQRVFGSHNKALFAVGFEINQTTEKRTGDETCYICGCYKKQGQDWITKGLQEGQVMCHRCYNNSDCNNGNLDPESPQGKAFKDQRVVAKVHKIPIKYDCNCRDGFGYPVDLYHKDRYKYINVKGSALRSNNSWNFNLTQEVTPDTYVMLGYDEDRKNILRVWITDAIDDFVFNDKTETLLKYKTITNSYGSLKLAEPWQVDAKPYNDMLHNMSLDNCSVLRSD